MGSIADSTPPECIDLVYRRTDGTHIFASKNIRGLVHVGHDDLETAFHNVFKALGIHVSHTYGVSAEYDCDTDFRTFVSMVESSSGFRFLHARLHASPSEESPNA